MSVPVRTLADDIAVEFAAARVVWRQARDRLARRDSPLNREAYDEAAQELDAILDMWNEATLDCE